MAPLAIEKLDTVNEVWVCKKHAYMINQSRVTMLIVHVAGPFFVDDEMMIVA